VPARGWRITSGHAGLAGVVCWALFAVVAWAVQHGHLAGYDTAGLRYWRSGTGLGWAGGTDSLEAVRDVTALGGVTLRTLFSAAAVTALLFLRLRREAVLLVLILISGSVIEAEMKLFFARPRPIIVPHLEFAGGMSFPSGHSFNSALGFIAVALAFATLSARRCVRWTVIGAAMLASAAVAFSRVMLGVHYPTDVIAGWLGGAGWAFLAEAVFYRPAAALTDSAAPADLMRLSDP
jgi:undecaprenyl-diphosphatase